MSDLLRPHRRSGDAVAVVGHPGTGKTATLQSVMRRAAAAGYRVVHGSGSAGPTALFDVLTAALREADDDATVRFGRLLDRASRRRPCLVAIDDLHLLPGSTIAELGELVRRSSAIPVLFVFACDRRTAELMPRDIGRRPVQPLSAASASVLLRRQPTVVIGRSRHEVLRRAAGNPRALIELARAAGAAARPADTGAPMPDTLRIQRRYASRLAAVPEATRRAMMYAASRLGSESLNAVLCAAGLRTAHPDVWGPAVEAGLVEVNRDLVFVDPLVAVALYDAAPAADRRRIHQDFAASELCPSFEKALHRARAALGPDAATASLLEQESVDARASGLLTDAILAAELSAELSTTRADTGRRYVLAVLAASTVGDDGWTQQLYTLAERITEDSDLRCAAACAAALVRSRQGFQRQAMDLLVRTARAFPPKWRTTAVELAVCAAVVANQSGLDSHTVTVAAMRDLVAEAPAPADDLARPSFLRPEDTCAQLAYIDVTIEPGVAGSFRHLLPGPAADPSTAIGKHTLAVVADLLSETAAAVRLWHDGLRGAGAGGEIAAWPEVWPVMVQGLIDLGLWQEASIALDAAEELVDTHDLTLLRVLVTALRGTLAGLRGDAVTARVLGESVWPQLPFECNGVGRMAVVRTLAVAAMTAGDFDTAYRHYRTLNEPETKSRHITHASHPVLGLAMAAHRAGRTREALPLVEAVRATFEPEPGLRMRLILEHALALLDEDDQTERRFMSVVTDDRAPVWPLEYALARFHFGAWLRRHRRPVEARAHLAAAHTILRDLGADALAEAARVELRASGGARAATAPPRWSGAPDGWALLSPQQREVARLAAQGLRNREIAEQLDLSPRTVSTHLYNSYLRLGITARHQLRDVPEEF